MRKTAYIGMLALIGFVAGCTNDQGINAATGALAGAAVGSQIGGGKGSTAATLAGAAIGTAIGANATPTNKVCTYRNPQTGALYEAPCN
ncbi:glycine zipper 2TM domain-containing protein [Sedimentimonas flavescens]|uniref:17 kDa surface antigen n=1 Tax=Sedimentimonas flavescens TaxID=2851012 RepID=A0ABT3A0A7_9RHOB|nr:glycine zipper 2TM domain-containing protein [Sedimentimonas flavescens]MBW0157562.1 glycine zipper 2TM domain-containing protein [Sedimentimonas flavescens]MCT2541157.1 glycine zipper 2TM domain-containing protein [Sedimentimonas flavescens]MCV2879366.1 glycine zipper 2TM domain-containing protein [Sedimentimonas flavescens]WBL32120.1 glycine zipper 2TM domain-containing protein [Sinirhodobacter sp. HNIBRBA609]